MRDFGKILVFCAVGGLAYIALQTDEPDKETGGSSEVAKTNQTAPKKVAEQKTNNPTLKVNSYGCLTKDLYRQFEKSILDADNLAYSYLLKNGCTGISPDIPISVLDITSDKRARIRAYTKDDGIVVWTHSRNIEK